MLPTCTRLPFRIGHSRYRVEDYRCFASFGTRGLGLLEPFTKFGEAERVLLQRPEIFGDVARFE